MKGVSEMVYPCLLDPRLMQTGRDVPVLKKGFHVHRRIIYLNDGIIRSQCSFLNTDMFQIRLIKMWSRKLL